MLRVMGGAFVIKKSPLGGCDSHVNVSRKRVSVEPPHPTITRAPVRASEPQQWPCCAPQCRPIADHANAAHLRRRGWAPDLVAFAASVSDEHGTMPPTPTRYAHGLHGYVRPGRDEVRQPRPHRARWDVLC